MHMQEFAVLQNKEPITDQFSLYFLLTSQLHEFSITSLCHILIAESSSIRDLLRKLKSKRKKENTQCSLKTQVISGRILILIELQYSYRVNYQ